MTRPAASAAGAAADDLLIFLIAGEPSGDALGGRLMAALKRCTGGRVHFAGVGGEAMAAAGLVSRFPMTELSLMGLLEVVPHLPRLRRRVVETAAAIRAARPAAVVTIDAPAFNFRVCARLRGSGIPLIHYVAPSVWAWRPGRARHVAGILDHLLALLPFEPRYFEVHGLPCTHVGHPVLETVGAGHDGPRFRRDHGLPNDAPVLCVLPGSRRGEVARLAPVFGRAVRLLALRYPALRAVVPTVPAVADRVDAAAAAWGVPTLVLRDPERKFDAFAAADAALAASGTVVLELAALGVPMVAAYRANPLTALLLRPLLKVRYATLVNLLLDRSVVPEYLQGGCTPGRLAAALERLLADDGARRAQRAGFAEALARLAVDGRPSERAAAVVLDLVRRRAGP